MVLANYDVHLSLSQVYVCFSQVSPPCFYSCSSIIIYSHSLIHSLTCSILFPKQQLDAMHGSTC